VMPAVNCMNASLQFSRGAFKHEWAALETKGAR
jgi:hypothetical protein